MATHRKSVAVVEYDKVFTYDHLFQAFYHCRSGKRKRKTVIDYEINLAKKITKLSKILKKRKYKPGKLYEFTIYEPKKRDIVANQFPDKLIQWVNCTYILEPLIAPKLIFDNYASQHGKGTDLARNRLEKFLKKYWNTYHTNEGYELRCDIKSYFGTIDRDTLFEMIKQLPMDEGCLEINRILIYSHKPEKKAGVCIGFHSMQWMAVYYMNGLDHFIKEKLHIIWYGRYNDDFYLIHPDKEYLQYCYEEIHKYVEDKLKLELNPKSGISKLGTNTNWLGFNYRLTKEGRIIVRVSKKSISRYVSKLKKYFKIYQYDAIELHQISQSLNSYAEHMSKSTNGKRLIQYLADQVYQLCDKYQIDPDVIIPSSMIRKGGLLK